MDGSKGLDIRGKKLTVTDICYWEFQGLQKVILECQKLGAICAEGQKKCDNCGSTMKMYVNAREADGYYWSCPGYKTENKKKQKKCNRVETLRHGTLFRNSKLAIPQV